MKLEFKNIDNGKEFYTDANGLELQKRILDFRPTWDLKLSEKAAGNYYPINAMMIIKDKKSANHVAVLNDRS